MQNMCNHKAEFVIQNDLLIELEALTLVIDLRNNQSNKEYEEMI